MNNVYMFARQYQTFSSVKEMNLHMNNYFYSNKEQLTESYIRIFDILKQFACKVPGVSWLKRETIAEHAHVSVKTVERALNTYKMHNVLKIIHTKRKNGLKGPSFYVLLPYENTEDELVLDSIEEFEQIDSNEEVKDKNVALSNIVSALAVPDLTTVFFQEKFFINSLNSFKFLINSFKINKDDDEKEIHSSIKKINNELKIENMTTIQTIIFEMARKYHFSTEFSTELAKGINESDLKFITCTTELKSILNLSFKRLDVRIKNKKSEPITNIPAYFPYCIKTEIELYFKNKAASTKNMDISRNSSNDPKTIIQNVKRSYQGKRGIPKWLIVSDAVKQVKEILKIDEDNARELVNKELGIKADKSNELELEDERQKLKHKLANMKYIVA